MQGLQENARPEAGIQGKEAGIQVEFLVLFFIYDLMALFFRERIFDNCEHAYYIPYASTVALKVLVLLSTPPPLKCTIKCIRQVLFINNVFKKLLFARIHQKFPF